MPRLLICLAAVLCLAGPTAAGPEETPDLIWRAPRPAPGPVMARSLAAVQQRCLAVDAGTYPAGQVHSVDEVETNDGQKLLGKVIEWGTHVILITNQGRRVFDRKELKSVEPHKRPEEMQKPDLPDLDVTFIERTPRLRSNHGNVEYDKSPGLPALIEPNSDPLYPAKGAPVTFTAHVLNKGARASEPAGCEWLFDGKPCGSGRLPALAPDAEATVALKRKWVPGAHTITFRVRPAGKEICTRNNQLADRTDALGFLITVTKESYAEYNRVPNMVDSFSFEDWVQFHFEVMNELFEESIYPEAPEGCLARMRVDKILYADEAVLEQQKQAAWHDGHPSGCYFEGTWGFGKWDRYDWRMARVDWGFLHEMGHQLGLIDEYRFFADPDQVHVRDNGEFVNLTHRYSRPETMMCWHGPHRFSDHATLALNLQLGRHRGFFGDYLFAMPRQSALRIRNREGQPVPYAKVVLYQRKPGKGVEDTPIAAGVADDRGLFVLPNRGTPAFQSPDGFALVPNPFGKVDVLGDAGLLLAKVQWGDWTEWHWIEIVDFNVAAMSGVADYARDVLTSFPSAGAPKPPAHLRAVYTSEHTVDVAFDAAPEAKSYRLYGKPDREGWSDSPFTLLQPLDGPALPGLDVSKGPLLLAATAVDARGKESGLSNVVLCGRLQGVSRIAVAPDGTRYISDTHPHTGRILRQRPDHTVDDWEVHPAPDTRGRFVGLALTAGGQLLATNSEGSRLHLFARTGEALKTVGEKGAGPGQLDRPAGVAVGVNDNVYVADTGNNRIQVFDRDLRWQESITAGLKEPRGVACLGDRLAVADTGNKRVILLEKANGTWRTAGAFDGFRQPVDVAADRAGRLLVADTEAGQVVVLNPDGTRVRTFDRLGPVAGVACAPDGTILAPVPWEKVWELRE